MTSQLHEHMTFMPHIWYNFNKVAYAK